MGDDHLIEEASAIADRRPATTTSPSDGIRLLDRLSRLFGSSGATAPAPGDAALFLWGALEVRRLLGAGSFGEVYEAWDPTLHREVALKLRSPESGALRWLDEARNLARVRHPNVLTIHGADVLDGRAGIWTERIIGRTLEEELRETGPFSAAECVRIGRDIASALAAVHAAGLIHGDVKTGNIMLEAGDAPRRAVLVDFGSADHTPGDEDVPAYAMGTPLTMAPEVLDGKAASTAADIYGLGATLFRLLTGRYPVEAASIEELRRSHRSDQRVHVRSIAPQTPARLAHVVERALEPDPAQRWPAARTLQRAFDDIADPTRRIRTRAAAIGAGVVAAVAVGFIAFLFLRPGGGPVSRGKLSAPSNSGAFVAGTRHLGPWRQAGVGYVAAVVDVDHDRVGDLVGVEPNWNGSDGRLRGRVVMLGGAATGALTRARVLIEGDEPDAQIGWQVVNAGDVDGDGFDEMLISQEAYGVGQMPARVRLYAGGAGAPRVVWTYEGQTRDAAVGRAMSCAGDVNGDDFDDVLISELNAPDLQRDEGRVLLFLGSRAGLSSAPAWSARGGQPVAWMGAWMRPLGDMNADGFDDVIVASNAWDGVGKSDCGQASVYLGSANGLAAEPVLVIEGANTNAHLGTTVGGAGDVNGDGYADAIIGEPQYSDEKRPERGRAVLYFGGPRGPSVSPDWQGFGALSYAHFGYIFNALGDVDGDGFDDVAIASPQYSEGKRVHLGMVEVYRGGRDGFHAIPLWRATGDAPDAHFGRLVAAGDLNGDGMADLVAGAPLWSDSLTERGLLATFLHRPARK